MKKYFLLSIALLNVLWTNGQWTNRYPKVDGYGHHVYLEGYELPVVNAGPMDPAPSPIDDKVVFSAKGWLWLYQLGSAVATRITSSPHLDARPNWSPDGQQIVFVRDDGSDTQIMLLDISSKKETLLVDSDKLDLDPIFSNSGSHVYYSSALEGSFDLWSIDLATLERSRIMEAGNLERLPVPVTNEKLVFLEKKGFSYDAIILYDLATNTTRALAQENFMSQTAFDLAPDHETLVYTWPQGDNYELRLLNVNKPESRMLVTNSKGLPLAPKFDHSGQWIYFAEYDQHATAQLKRISAYGGQPEVLTIKEWDWQTATSNLKIKSTVDGQPAPVRLNIIDSNGHPVIPDKGVVRSEGQNGLLFFYSAGELEVEAPVGRITITATHGFETTKHVQTIDLTAEGSEVTLNLQRIWNPNEAGWYAADNHFHLNYGGTSRLDPEDILVDLEAEGIDVGYPLVANLGNRFLQQDLVNWQGEGLPLLRFGQEVRSHFFGHLNIIGTNKLFWPWVWGPFYDIYGADDRLNAEPLRFARKHGALGGYVHPVGVQDPFVEQAHRGVPRFLVADAVLGEVDLLEIGCLWTDEIGTAALWHQFLNLGMPVAMSAGSDVMNDLYRTMAIGATRIYVKPSGSLTEKSYLQALKNGQSFVSNGPQVVFKLDGMEPGAVVSTTNKKVKWTLDVYTPIAYDKIELFVNGEVVWTKKSKGKSIENYRGSLEVPVGGWVTARVSGGQSVWPMMDSYPFAETSPIWFREIGSTSTTSQVEAARKLISILKSSKEMVDEFYQGEKKPKIDAHFEQARQKLMKIINSKE